MRLNVSCNPEVSVIMSVFNTKEKYLRQAIESILNQSFKDYEFIIFNDCSDEKTAQILRQYKDQRIRLIENEENKGLTKNLNAGLNIAKGKYIARMDSDDISLHHRLKIQYSYMERHIEVDILGGMVLNNNTKDVYWKYFPQEWRRVNMLFGNYGICHPTAFLRTEFLRKNRILYNENYSKAQDYELWTRILKLGKMAVCNKPVLYYRCHDGQISKNSCTSIQQKVYDKKIRENLFREIDPGIQENELLQLLNMESEIISADNLTKLFLRLVEENRKRKVYSHYFLKNVLAIRWFWIIGGGLYRTNVKEYRHGYWFRYILNPKFCLYYTVYKILYTLCEPRKIEKVRL